MPKKILKTKPDPLAEEKEKFFSTVAHQLRTPLTTIRFLVEVIMASNQGDKLTDEQRHKLQLIKEADERAINLVSDMLDVSKLVAKEISPEFQSCDLQETIQERIGMLQPAAEAKGQKVVFEVPQNIRKVNTCSMYLTRAFQNILDNAISYGDKNSIITVTLGEDGDHDAYIVKVHNFGPSIPKSEMPKMFQKFHRVPGSELLKPTGTGLGLFIAKSAIELNGGGIWIESDAKGVTVYFTVPFAPPKKA